MLKSPMMFDWASNLNKEVAKETAGIQILVKRREWEWRWGMGRKIEWEVGERCLMDRLLTYQAGLGRCWRYYKGKSLLNGLI